MNVATPKKSKQSRDVVAAIQNLLGRGPFGYGILLEDDWVACHGFYANLATAVARARAVHGDFTALRFWMWAASP